MNSSALDASRNEQAAPQKSTPRTAMAQLVHALNQPLTGLQCSMEVALARPRTAEQHVFGLREALVLTKRMRALVQAIREVADMEEADIATGEEQSRDLEASELESVLREAAEDLRPVAAERNVRIALDFSTATSAVSPATRRQSPIARAAFRLLDSALSLSAPGTVVHVETRIAEKIWLRMQWQAAAPRSQCSRPELGLLIAQAELERYGAEWQRDETDDGTVLTVRRASGHPRSQPAGSSE